MSTERESVKRTVFHHELQRLRQYDLLNIFARLGHVVGAVGVADGDDVLGDDRSFVEALGRIVEYVRGHKYDRQHGAYASTHTEDLKERLWKSIL